jgi:ribosomal protein L24E
MHPNNVSAGDEQVATCFFCGKIIADGAWFARFRHESRLILFCRPFCVESFFERKEKSDAERAAAFRPWETGLQ